MTPSTKKKLMRAGAFLLLALVALVMKYGPRAETAPAGPAPAGPATGESGELAAAIREGRSDVWVESAGRVSRVLPDDDEGSRHQRFIVELTAGETILIAHNIDLAPRAPVERGDRIEFRGEYEWNDKGGVVHWTHHDPGGRHEGGWLRHEGRDYR